MTVRDIEHHLVLTIGTQVSRETISKITDEVADEILAWQCGGRSPNIEDKRAGDRAEEKGQSRGQKRTAEDRLVEGQVTTNWKQALAQLAIAYPDRINPACKPSPETTAYTNNLTGSTNVCPNKPPA